MPPTAKCKSCGCRSSNAQARSRLSTTRKTTPSIMCDAIYGRGYGPYLAVRHSVPHEIGRRETASETPASAAHLAIWDRKAKEMARCREKRAALHHRAFRCQSVLLVRYGKTIHITRARKWRKTNA